jgi:hypothetical protein
MCPQAGHANHQTALRRDASTKTLTGLLPHWGQSAAWRDADAETFSVTERSDYDAQLGPPQITRDEDVFHWEPSRYWRAQK